MDFLNKTVAQITDLFKTMTPGARLTSGMLLVLILASLGYLFVNRSGGPRRYLFGSQEFSREDIVAMQRAFGTANLDDYEMDGQRVRVPARRLNEYLQALDKANFDYTEPDSEFARLEEQGMGLFASSEDRKWVRSEMKAHQFRRTIEKFPEISRATVRFTETKEPGTFPPKVRRAASVIVASIDGNPLSRTSINKIRSSAADWFNVDIKEVGITDQNGTAIPVGGSADGLDPETRPYIMAKAYQEDRYEQQLGEVLRYIGPGLIAVAHVELDETLTSESTKVTVDPQTVPTKTNTLTKTYESSPPDGSRPGAVPNRVSSDTPRTLASVNQQQSSSEENLEQQESITGHQQVRQVTAGLVPKRVTASIGIPWSYIRGLYYQRNPDADSAEPAPQTALADLLSELKTQVEEQVVKILPSLPPGEDQYPLVNVTSYEDLPPKPLEEPTLASQALGWAFLNWKSFGLLLVGLVSLLVLRSMLRGTTAQAPVAVPEEIAAAVTAAEPREVEEDMEPTTPLLAQHHGNSGASLREQLITIVREDPDAAANVLRTWIGDAA